MTEIDATIDQKPTEHTDRAQDSNDESIAATEAVDAAGATPRPAGPVDDAVDESRDGIYVSRETVRPDCVRWRSMCAAACASAAPSGSSARSALSSAALSPVAACAA